MLTFLKFLARATGLSGLLYRFGWAGPIGDAIRTLTSAAERRRSTSIQIDFDQVASRWPELFKRDPSVKPSKTVWVVSTLSMPWSYKLEAILAHALESEGFRAVILSPSHDKWRFRYHRLFGFKSFIDFQSVLAIEDAVSAEPEIHSFKANPSTTALLDIRYRDVDIGRIALSNVLYRNKFSKLDLTSPATIAEIETDFAAIKRNVNTAERMIATRRHELVVLVEKGISPYAEIFGACVSAGIPVVQYANAQHESSYAVKRYSLSNRHQHIFSLSHESWEMAKRMPWGPEFEAELLREFESSYSQGRWFGRKYLHDGKLVKSPDEVKRQLGLDPAKKTAVVFSHVLWDATFFYGVGLFENYETWLEQVVKAAYKNTSVNWVIKLHPDLMWKLKLENYNGKLRDLLVIVNAAGGLPPHIKIVPPETDIDTLSFFGITDYCLTVRGTIGIEMACRGIPVVTAGTGRYSGMGFTVDSSTTEEYLQRLARIQDTPTMTAAQTELARRFAFTLFKMRPWTLKSFRFERMALKNVENPLSVNILPPPEMRTAADFRAAADIRSFAAWAAGDQEDYLVDVKDRIEI